MERFPLTPGAAVTLGALVLVVATAVLAVLAAEREVGSLRARLAEEAAAVRSLGGAPGAAAITDTERALWTALEGRLRSRYPSEAEAPRAAGLVADLARSSGMEIVSVEVHVPPTAAPPAAPSPSAPPPTPQPAEELDANPASIKLSVQHRYGSLVEFLEGLPGLPVYVTVQSLEVKRLDDQLMTEMSLGLLRWRK